VPQILVVSEDVSILSDVMLALLALLYPFQWAFTLITVRPCGVPPCTSFARVCV
jgi:hypothetical protein